MACTPAPSQEGSADIAVSAQALSTSEVTRVTLTVSAADISPSITANLRNTGGQWRAVIGAIPAGTHRTFLAQAFNSSNTLLYEGQATGATIISGATAAVVILLQQTTAPTPFVNSAPKIAGLTASTDRVDLNEPVTLAVTDTDADGDARSYAWTATGGSFANGDTANPAWTAPATEGTYTLSVSVTDGKGGQAGISLMIAVVRAKGAARVAVAFNAWPVATQVTGSPSGQVAPGGIVSLDVAAVDPDNDALSYSWADDCSGSFSDTSVQNPTWTAPATAPSSGVCTVTVSLSDGRGGSTTGQLGINLGLPQIPTQPPVIDQLFQSTDTVAVNGTVDLVVSAHDPEGTAITFTWSASAGTLGSPATSASRSEIVWTAPALGTSSTLTLVIQDASGQRTTQTFPITLTGGMLTYVAVAAGDNHGLAVRSDGTVWAWGLNTSGQLGNGSTTTQLTPVQVPGLTGIVAVAAGRTHSLAVRSDGTVWAWGYNSSGQLGDGSTTNELTPIQVADLTGAVAVAAGNAFSLALRQDGTVWAWGDNTYGQLGDGTGTTRRIPVRVSNLSGVTSLAAGWYHALAVRQDGTVWGWGSNSNGELGIGTLTAVMRTPIQPLGMDGVVAVGAGERHSLAVRSDGTVWGWGSNGDGELCIAPPDSYRKTPTQLAGMSGITALSGGYYHSMALRSDGTGWACGSNNYGQLGHGSTGSRYSAAQVADLGEIVAMSARGFKSLAVRSDGTVWAWGNNTYGQLGDGTTTNRFAPVQVQLP